jgi:hypothetical protein
MHNTPRVQQLTLKTDPETIRQMTKAYDMLRHYHDACHEKQREAYNSFRRRQLGLE